MEIIFTILLLLFIIADIAMTAIGWRRTRLERKLAAKRLRAKHLRFVGFLKCHAHLFRIDRDLEQEFSPFAKHADLKPVKEGDVFIHCISRCEEWRTCPVLEKLLDKFAPHELGDADGLRIIKRGIIHKDGTATFVLDKPADDQKVSVKGCAFDSAIHPGHVCYVRFDLPNREAKDPDGKLAEGERADGGTDNATPLPNEVKK